MNTYNITVNKELEVRKDLSDFLETIDKNVSIVCATKYANSTSILKLLDYGLSDFGENRVDSFLEKYNALINNNITWHFIGHLQTNKALKVIDKIDYLHSLDSLKLAKIIDSNRTTPLKCFIQVNVTCEKTKYGLSESDLDAFILEVLKYPMIELVGLMTIGIKDDSRDKLIDAFSRLHELKDRLNTAYSLNMKYLSMGMSDDYKEAIECGATHIRLGRILWE